MAELLDRPFAPTPRRRREARQDGKVARSTDLAAACCLLVGAGLLYVLGSSLLGQLTVFFASLLDRSLTVQPLQADGGIGELAAGVWSLTGSLMLGLLAAAAVAGVAQVGFLVTLKPLEPQLERLGPGGNLKQIVGSHARMRLGMTWIKLLAASLVTGVTLGQLWLPMIGTVALQSEHLAGALGGMLWTLAWRLGLVLLVLGGVDYLWQRWQHDRDLFMTRQQWQDEMRQMDGDPLTRQRQSRVARQLAVQRISHVIPQADVVVTGQREVAVALRYDPKTMRAAQVVAKATGALAGRVRTLAAAHDVPVVQREELADQLDRQAQLGRDVPTKLIRDVAEVLAYAGQVRGKRRISSLADHP